MTNTPEPGRVLVTGGSGKLARPLHRRLLDHRWTLATVDRLPPPEDQGCPYARVDLTDCGQAVEAVTGIQDRWGAVDAVAHLAAVPAPGQLANAATFANNALTTHNIFAAARLAGVRNV